MLDEYALGYLDQGDGMLQLIAFATIGAGGIAAGMLHKSRAEMRRAPYFAWCGLLFLVTSATQLVWIGAVQAYEAGYLWALVAVDLIGGLLIGYGYGIISMARSRDAFGHARWAFLAFIPFGNLVLLLTGSKSETSANRPSVNPVMAGGLGIFTGFIMFSVGIAISAFIQAGSERVVAEQELAATREPTLEEVLGEIGMEQTLAAMTEMVFPRRIDEITSLLGGVAEGSTFRYLYEVSVHVEALPASTRTGTVQQNCGNDGLRPLIDAGATIEHFYQHTDGSVIGVITITRAICEAG